MAKNENIIHILQKRGGELDKTATELQKAIKHHQQWEASYKEDIASIKRTLESYRDDLASMSQEKKAILDDVKTRINAAESDMSACIDVAESDINEVIGETISELRNQVSEANQAMKDELHAIHRKFTVKVIVCVAAGSLLAGLFGWLIHWI